MIAYMGLMGWIFSQGFGSGQPDPAMFFAYFRFFPVIIGLASLALYVWLWTTGMGLQEKIPVGVRPKVGRFKVALTFVAIYLLSFLVFFDFLTNGILQPAFLGGMETVIPWMIAIIFPLHFFAMFCTFFSMYFVAKTIKMAELQREVTFSDFVGEFFMLWFYPIGIWILQPKINQLAKS